MLKKKNKSKVKKIIKGLKKASKLHAAQAKTLKGILKNGKRSKLETTSGKKEMEMLKKKKTIKKVIKGLKKASRLHAGQAKALKGVIGEKKKRS